MALVKRIALNYIRTKFKLLSAISKRKAAEQALRLFITPQSRVRKPLTQIFLQAEDVHFIFSGVTVKGYRWNAGAAKKLLIVHGYESSVVNFEAFIPRLLHKGYCILAFDAPAHGSSGGKSLNAIEYTDFVIEINNRFGPIDAYITHSFGGLAVSLALEQLPHSKETKVVLIAPATESITAINQFFNFLRINGAVRNEFDRLITEANNKPPGWYSVSRAAAHIKASVLFLQDKEDPLTPLSDVQPLIDKQYPNFNFIITKGLGHKKIYRDTGNINSIINFL
ncbi:MAG: alpha/beta hydrolase [Candidatus Dadabacteria bacterium]